MDHKDRMARAEDYVFGLMDEKARERAERDMETDAEFRNCVMVLAERLRMLHRAKGPAPVSDQAWNEITTHIARMPQMGAAGTGGVPHFPTPDPGRKGFLGVKRPFAHQFGGVRGTMIAACLIAAMAVGYMAGQVSAPAPQALAVVVLADTDGTPAAIVEIHEGDRVRVLPLEDFAIPDGKVAQLWTLAADGTTPAPLGALARTAETVLHGPELPAPQHGQPYRVTLENMPGAPEGRPQGPELFSGTAVVPPR